MGTNPTITPVEEVFLAGTFATVFGFTASADDLLAGMETTKVELRFFIDEGAKVPAALLCRVDSMTLAEPSEFKGGFEIKRQLNHGMKKARGANKARSAKLGFEGTGRAMGYTVSASDNSDERQMAVKLTSLREAVARFTYGKHFPEDYTVYGRMVRSASQQANDWVLIQEYLDQRSI